MSAPRQESGVLRRYIELGLALGRHIDGLVDAYYGPPELARRAGAGPVADPADLVGRGRALVASLDGGEALGGESGGPGPGADARRRRWIRAQTVGLLTTARRLAGEPVGYAEEVESCYGVAPRVVPDEDLAAAHGRLEEALPGSGPLAERLIAWREAHAVSVDRLPGAIAALADALRERTERLFGLPEGEHIDFELVTDKPWSGFNLYLGGLRSTVSVNTDLPVLSTSLAHLVAHEAYPGHHTEHCRKEVGLVRRRRWLEESIFLVGTPQCLLAEGLADLGLEVVVGRRPEAFVADILGPLGIRYDAEVVAAVAEAGEVLGAVRGQRRVAPARRGGRPRHGGGRGGSLGSPAPGARRQGRRVPAPSDVAGLRVVLHRRPGAVPPVRGRRPGPLRRAADRAARPRRPGGLTPPA